MTADSFSSEYAAGFPRMAGYAHRRGIPDAENVAQQVWARAWECRDQYHGRNGALLRTWVETILRNEVKSYWRRPLNRCIEYMDKLPDACGGASDPTLIVADVLARLRTEDRALLTARYLDGWTVKQIAEQRGTTVCAVKMRLYRARVAARETVNHLPVQQNSAKACF